MTGPGALIRRGAARKSTSTGSLSLQQMLMLFALYRLELCVQTRDGDEPDQAQPEW
jgi:HTH-type transcriptional regulator/antitoxin HipB